MNGRILNMNNIARECFVPRSTVEKYFSVLFDTLIAYTLPAYTPGLKVKETRMPKFYIFDPGIARGCAGLTRENLDKSYKEPLFETYVLNEIRAYNHCSGKNRKLSITMYQKLKK